MPNRKEKILIVDDEESIRTSMTLILTESGYYVQSAADGFSALIEMRREMPDILVSDLNMPGLSGYELLSVVRSQIPTLHVIAMSGAYSDDQVPDGVAADAFYRKGGGIGSLLRMIESPATSHRMPVKPIATAETLWLEAPAARCPECREIVLRNPDKALDQFVELACVHCRDRFRPQSIESATRATVLPFRRSQQFAAPSLHRMDEFSQ